MESRFSIHSRRSIERNQVSYEDPAVKVSPSNPATSEDV